MERIIELCSKLTPIPGVSGDEQRSYPELKNLIGYLFDEYGFTGVNSFYGIKKSKKKNAKTLLLDAHLDTIGFIVTKICDGGFLKVSSVGGTAEKNLAASEVWIHGKETIPGVFASKPPHLQEPGEAEKKINLNDMSIDTGLSKEKLEEIVRIGTYISFKSTFEKLNENVYVSPYFDDRLCGAAILRAIEMTKDEDLGVNIAFQFTSNEETTGAGAATTAYRMQPDFAIIVDVAHAWVPGAPESLKDISEGKGCMLSYSAETNRTFTKKMVALAKKNDIPIQLDAEPNYTATNTRDIMQACGGIPSVLISIPLKNMHTANEIADMRDAKSCADLIAAFLRELPYCGKEED